MKLAYHLQTVTLIRSCLAQEQHYLYHHLLRLNNL